MFVPTHDGIFNLFMDTLILARLTHSILSIETERILIWSKAFISFVWTWRPKFIFLFRKRCWWLFTLCTTWVLIWKRLLHGILIRYWRNVSLYLRCWLFWSYRITSIGSSSSTSGSITPWLRFAFFWPYLGVITIIFVVFHNFTLNVN